MVEIQNTETAAGRTLCEDCREADSKQNTDKQQRHARIKKKGLQPWVKPPTQRTGGMRG